MGAKCSYLLANIPNISKGQELAGTQHEPPSLPPGVYISRKLEAKGQHQAQTLVLNAGV